VLGLCDIYIKHRCKVYALQVLEKYCNMYAGTGSVIEVTSDEDFKKELTSANGSTLHLMHHSMGTCVVRFCRNICTECCCILTTCVMGMWCFPKI